MLLQNRRTKETFPLSSLRLLSWVPYTASLWSLVYGLLGLYWAVGGPGFPFGEHDVKAAEMGALFINVRAPEAGPLIAVLGILGTLNALAMTRLWRSRLVALCLLTFAYGACALLILVIPDGRVLMYVGYFLTLHPGQMDGVLLNQFACLLGGLLWALTALIYQRKSRSACLHCARTTSIAATRGISWGYLLTIIAIAMPLLYTLTRWAWALGIPLGMSWLPPSSPLEVGLGAAAAGGALLTLGLIQRWGSASPAFFPCWEADRFHLPLLSSLPLWFR
ncbi:hypothetical protein EPA93_27010 [Ktedonosporobacter rubrisoli]|uniref:Uncharacterized protein n=1 Tax=Ktedonosporobacter rubrisoli TaxID=2509675 RepID=A0A4P6JUW4_KTERU|nr:hypothetical protein [Ktedonosporobacter rubrisoli]QBD79437.1 hypothetical protein EPA93_27010 [Ktedonosporobacter rubrisoli]